MSKIRYIAMIALVVGSAVLAGCNSCCPNPCEPNPCEQPNPCDPCAS